MAKIYKFQKPNEHECEDCGHTEDSILVYEANDIDPFEVVGNFTQLALDANTPEALFAILYRLYNTARKIGFKDALESEIEMKMDVLNEIEGSICTCGQCDID